MTELFNYFITKFIYVKPEMFSQAVSSAEQYEAFLYYSLKGMEKGEWMFLKPQYFSRCVDFIAKCRGTYPNSDIVELENECIRRYNTVSNWDEKKRIEYQKLAIQKEKMLRSLPFYFNYSLDDYEKIWVADFYNFDVLTSFNPSQIIEHSKYPDFIYTLAFLRHWNELCESYPRMNSFLMQETFWRVYTDSIFQSLLSQATQTKDEKVQKKLVRSIYRNIKGTEKRNSNGK